MGHQSCISGYILQRDDRRSIEHNRGAVAAYPFDEVFPFTNIFWFDSPADYFFPLIGLTGSYKQVEEFWSEWLWKFSQLLSRLEALEAYVNLDCVGGEFRWKLKAWSVHQELPLPPSLVGERWGITKAPSNG